jgi:hypothetical protein
MANIITYTRIDYESVCHNSTCRIGYRKVRVDVGMSGTVPANHQSGLIWRSILLVRSTQYWPDVLETRRLTSRTYMNAD